MSYEMHPEAFVLVKMFDDGMDVINDPVAHAAAQKALADRIFELDTDVKGMVIVSLLTINQGLARSIVASRLPQAVEG